MELSHSDGKLQVNYGDRLVTLLREVRQLTAMGFNIPAKIQHTAHTAQKFYRHGVILKQVMEQRPTCTVNIPIRASQFINQSINQSKPVKFQV